MEFNGYIRANGQVGIRNHLLILPSVVCANSVAIKIADGILGAVAVPHQHGCSQLGVDREQTLRTLAGLAKNPNVGGVLIVGLGCEVINAKSIAEEVIPTGKYVETLEIQEIGGTPRAIAKGKMLALKIASELNKQQRRPVSLEHLTLGTECGGSDAYSGLSANPALGVASDLLIEHGGRVILSETTEFIGAEHILCRRAETPQIAEQIMSIVNKKEQEALAMKVDLRETQPSPGNMAGGLSTIEEKSLGCIYKGGSKPIVEVVRYGEIPRKKGLVVMDTPGNDMESVVGMLAGGAQIIVFTTGRGTPVGSPIAPVIKVASNEDTYLKLIENMDINAGTILKGEKTISEVGKEIFDEIIEVANGKLTKAEALCHCEFSISRIGPSF